MLLIRISKLAVTTQSDCRWILLRAVNVNVYKTCKKQHPIDEGQQLF